MVKKIIITNHKENKCGVYQYGKRFASILLNQFSNNYQYHYIEIDNKLEYFKNICEINPDIIIHNYLDITMPWFDIECFNLLKNKNIPQGLIVHNTGYNNIFDFFIHQNPFHTETKNNFAIGRPLFTFNSTYRPIRKIPIINTFGFAFPTKQYEKIAKLVNDCFDRAEINMNLTKCSIISNDIYIEKIKELCIFEIKKPDIKLNITHDFKTDIEILKFLDEADINIFLYQNYGRYNGISSTIDYALSVKRPIAVCKSEMFSHINKTFPSICIEDSSILEILKNGTKPLEKFYRMWNHKNFFESFENIINIVLNKNL